MVQEVYHPRLRIGLLGQTYIFLAQILLKIFPKQPHKVVMLIQTAAYIRLASSPLVHMHMQLPLGILRTSVNTTNILTVYDTRLYYTR